MKENSSDGELDRESNLPVDQNIPKVMNLENKESEKVLENTKKSVKSIDSLKIEEKICENNQKASPKNSIEEKISDHVDIDYGEINIGVSKSPS